MTVALVLSAMLLAASPASKPTVETIGHVEKDDVAVFDCTRSSKHLDYSSKQTAPYQAPDRVAYHLKGWDGQSIIAYYQVDNDVVVNDFGHPLVVDGGSAVSITFFYPPLSTAEIKITRDKAAMGTITATEKDRHGQGEVQISGTCKAEVVRWPAAGKSAS